MYNSVQLQKLILPAEVNAMENYEGINRKLIQFSQFERDVINEKFCQELKNECKNFMDEFNADLYSEVTLDEMYRSVIEKHYTPTGETIEEEFEWYQDGDGDLWYHEIPASIANGKPVVVSVKPKDKTFLELFLGDENYQAFMQQTR